MERDPAFTPRRVRDRMVGDLGWAVAQTGWHHYRVEWDRPTPHQDIATPEIPSMFFEWVSDRETAYAGPDRAPEPA